MFDKITQWFTAKQEIMTREEILGDFIDSLLFHHQTDEATRAKLLDAAELNEKGDYAGAIHRLFE